MSIPRLFALLLISISLSKTGTACTCAPPMPGEEDRMIRVVHGIYFGLLVEWLTDLTVQTAFWEMGHERHSAESHFLELDSEESLNTPNRSQHPR